jgi:large subunit ribosomal protein L10
MSQRVKRMLMDALRDEFSGVRDVLVIDLTGVDAVADGQMRSKLREKDMRLKVVKNSLARRALSDLGLEPVVSHLEGPTALVWGGESIVELAKEITAWTKEIEALKIKGGATEGQPLNRSDVEALSKLPNRQELLGMVVGRLLGPGARVAGMLIGPGGRLAGQIKTKAESE